MAPGIYLAQRGEDVVDVGSGLVEFVEGVREDVETWWLGLAVARAQ
jgi:hypothetical protein